jgi:Uma2 family endonuclease
MIASPAQTGMALDEFIRAYDREPFEVIDGERVAKMPNVFGPSYLINLLFSALLFYVTEHKLGKVFSETTFVLPGTKKSGWVTGSRIPDIMFYEGKRIDNYIAANKDYAARPLELIPDLVVEVISPTDLYSDVSRKIDAYLRDGVPLIWVIDSQRRVATIYEKGKVPQSLTEIDSLHGNTFIPGFEMALSELF